MTACRPFSYRRERWERPRCALGLAAGLALLLAAWPGVASRAAGGGYVLDLTIQEVPGALPADAWRELAGLDMTADGALYVSDAFDGRITVLGPGSALRVLVPPGGGLVSPTHLAVDVARGRLYVSDPGAGALVVVDLVSGAVLRRHEGISGAAGLGVAPDGRAFIASADTGRVHVFGPAGEDLGSWSAVPDDGQPGVGDLLRGLDVDADSLIHVVDGRRERVTVFDAAGDRRSTLHPPAMAIDVAVEYDPQLSTRKRTWLATANGVARYDPRTGAWDLAAGRPPMAIALRLGLGSATGHFAEDGSPARVELRHYGRFGGGADKVWGRTASIPGTLNGPLGVSIAADGRLLVLDLEPRVQRFEPDGAVVDLVGVRDAVDTAGAADGRLFVLGPGYLRALAPTGQALWTRALAAAGVGLAYLPDTDSLALLLSTGEVLRHAAADGSTLPGGVLLAAPPGQTPRWSDLAADGSGALFALDYRGPAVTRVAPDGQQVSFPVGGGARRLTATAEGAVLTLGRDGWVRRYAADGRLEGAFDAVRFDVAVASDPVDLAADGLGRLFVADRKAGLVSRFRWDPEVPAGTAPDDASGCRYYPDKRAAPGTIWLGETVDVRLTLRGGCGYLEGAAPLDIVLIIDESGSMSGEKIRIAREAARDFVAEMNLVQSQVAVIGFNSSARVYQRLTQDAASLYRAIERLRADGGTQIDRGLAEARQELAARGRPGLARPVFVLLSDGHNNTGPDPVLAEATAAKVDGIEIFTIGIRADEALMAAVASSPEHYFAPDDARFLYEVFDAIAQRITTATLFRRLLVTDRIPANMRYIGGSAEPPAAYDPAAHTLTWTLDNVAFRGFGLGYTLQPLEIGTWPTNIAAWGEGSDGYDRPARVDFPVPQVAVLGPTATPSPTPTPSTTPTPTATPTRTASPTATHSPTATPSPSRTPSPTRRPTRTPTPRPRPVYLPLTLREACNPTQRRADVVLVLDASTSMEGAKLAAARAAARRFVDLVLPPGTRPGNPTGHNLVAIVGFHASAWLARPLTDDAGAVQRAIEGLAMAPGTRIDRGLEVASKELWGPRHVPGHVAALVLLTDGLQNGPVEPVYRLADTARSRGAAIFTIGLGADVDDLFLATLAGGADRRYLAPGPADLAAIYDQIAGEILCAGAFWGQRRGH